MHQRISALAALLLIMPARQQAQQPLAPSTGNRWTWRSESPGHCSRRGLQGRDAAQ